MQVLPSPISLPRQGAPPDFVLGAHTPMRTPTRTPMHTGFGFARVLVQCSPCHTQGALSALGAPAQALADCPGP